MFLPLLASALAAGAIHSTAVESSRGAVASAEVTSEGDSHSLLGLSVDAGVPSGAGASLLVRPLPWLRLHGGVATNAASLGLRGGVSFTPFRSFVTPALTLGAGHFFEGDASGVAATVVVLPSYGDEMLRRVSYDYASAQLGLEFGSQDAFAFFVRGGLAWISSDLHGTGGQVGGSSERITFEASNPTVTATIPSAELGITFYLL